MMDDDAATPTMRAAAERLTSTLAVQNDRLEATNAAIVNLTTTTRRSRRLIRILAVSLVFDVVLSLGLAYALNQNREAGRAACRESNETREGSIALWEGIANAAPATTPEQHQRTDAVLALVHRTYAPRDCG